MPEAWRDDAEVAGNRDRSAQGSGIEYTYNYRAIESRAANSDYREKAIFRKRNEINTQCWQRKPKIDPNS